MANSRKYPSALAWIDLETTGLPVGNDYSGVEILEIGLIVTDFDLKPYFGYQGIVKMDDDIKRALAANPEVVQMHLANGLLKESKESKDTLREIESEIIGMFKTRTTQEKGEFMLAGSGVTAYDFNVLKEKMPELASYFSYFSLDIGIVRRAFNVLSGGADLVPTISESFVEGNKKHRALEDIKAHLKEANEYKKFLRAIADEQK